MAGNGETVALVFPDPVGEAGDLKEEAKLIDVAGPIDDIGAPDRGIVFTINADWRGIREALETAGTADDFFASGEHVIYGRIVNEDDGGMTVAPIVYTKAGRKHNETGYEDDVRVHVDAAHINGGRILVARGVDLDSLETGEAETSAQALTWSSTPRHASQSETMNGMSGRGK